MNPAFSATAFPLSDAFPRDAGGEHDQKCSGSRKHIDFSLFCPQTGPDKVVRTVGEVYTIT